VPSLKYVMESALYVEDVTRAVAFYRDVLGLRTLGEFEPTHGAALAVGNTVLLLFRAEETLQGGRLPAHGARGSGHVAFCVDAQELEAWKQHLEARGVRIEQEFSFRGSPPSLYFRDPDGNLLELAVTTVWPWDEVTKR